ncbi:MAG: ATP-binding protein, partial [Candidatus Omnitrophica bacterium]|nr:ATP-binding protein [Candidatus Omnitrophota bacterium]
MEDIEKRAAIVDSLSNVLKSNGLDELEIGAIIKAIVPLENIEEVAERIKKIASEIASLGQTLQSLKSVSLVKRLSNFIINKIISLKDAPGRDLIVESFREVIKPKGWNQWEINRLRELIVTLEELEEIIKRVKKSSAKIVSLRETLQSLGWDEMRRSSILLSVSLLEEIEPAIKKIEQAVAGLPETKWQRGALESELQGKDKAGGFSRSILRVNVNYPDLDYMSPALSSSFVAGEIEDYYVIITNTHAVSDVGGNESVSLSTKSGEAIGKASLVLRHEQDDPYKRDIGILLIKKDDVNGGNLESMEIGGFNEGDFAALVSGSNGTVLAGELLRLGDVVFLVSEEDTVWGDSGSPYLIRREGKYVAAAVNALKGPVGMLFSVDVIKGMLRALDGEESDFIVVTKDAEERSVGEEFLEGLLLKMQSSEDVLHRGSEKGASSSPVKNQAAQRYRGHPLTKVPVFNEMSNNPEAERTKQAVIKLMSSSDFVSSFPADYVRGLKGIRIRSERFLIRTFRPFRRFITVGRHLPIAKMIIIYPPLEGDDLIETLDHEINHYVFSNNRKFRKLWNGKTKASNRAFYMWWGSIVLLFYVFFNFISPNYLLQEIILFLQIVPYLYFILRIRNLQFNYKSRYVTAHASSFKSEDFAESSTYYKRHKEEFYQRAQSSETLLRKYEVMRRIWGDAETSQRNNQSMGIDASSSLKIKEILQKTAWSENIKRGFMGLRQIIKKIISLNDAAKRNSIVDSCCETLGSKGLDQFEIDQLMEAVFPLENIEEIAERIKKSASEIASLSLNLQSLGWDETRRSSILLAVGLLEEIEPAIEKVKDAVARFPETKRQRGALESELQGKEKEDGFSQSILRVNVDHPDLYCITIWSSSFVAGEIEGYYVIITNTHVISDVGENKLVSLSTKAGEAIGKASLVLRHKFAEPYTRDIAILLIKAEDVYVGALEPIEIGGFDDGDFATVVSGSNGTVLAGELLRLGDVVFLVSEEDTVWGDSGSPYLIKRGGKYAAAVHTLKGPVGMLFSVDVIKGMLRALDGEESDFIVVTKDAEERSVGKEFLEGLLLKMQSSEDVLHRGSENGASSSPVKGDGFGKRNFSCIPLITVPGTYAKTARLFYRIAGLAENILNTLESAEELRNLGRRQELVDLLQEIRNVVLFFPLFSIDREKLVTAGIMQHYDALKGISVAGTERVTDDLRYLVKLLNKYGKKSEVLKLRSITAIYSGRVAVSEEFFKFGQMVFDLEKALFSGEIFEGGLLWDFEIPQQTTKVSLLYRIRALKERLARVEHEFILSLNPGVDIRTMVREYFEVRKEYLDIMQILEESVFTPFEKLKGQHVSKEQKVRILSLHGKEVKELLNTLEEAVGPLNPWVRAALRVFLVNVDVYGWDSEKTLCTILLRAVQIAGLKETGEGMLYSTGSTVTLMMTAAIARQSMYELTTSVIKEIYEAVKVMQGDTKGGTGSTCFLVERLPGMKQPVSQAERILSFLHGDKEVSDMPVRFLLFGVDSPGDLPNWDLNDRWFNRPSPGRTDKDASASSPVRSQLLMKGIKHKVPLVMLTWLMMTLLPYPEIEDEKNAGNDTGAAVTLTVNQPEAFARVTIFTKKEKHAEQNTENPAAPQEESNILIKIGGLLIAWGIFRTVWNIVKWFIGKLAVRKDVEEGSRGNKRYTASSPVGINTGLSLEQFLQSTRINNYPWVPSDPVPENMAHSEDIINLLQHPEIDKMVPHTEPGKPVVLNIGTGYFPYGTWRMAQELFRFRVIGTEREAWIIQAKIRVMDQKALDTCRSIFARGREGVGHKLLYGSFWHRERQLDQKGPLSLNAVTQGMEALAQGVIEGVSFLVTPNGRRKYAGISGVSVVYRLYGEPSRQQIWTVAPGLTMVTPSGMRIQENGDIFKDLTWNMFGLNAYDILNQSWLSGETSSYDGTFEVVWNPGVELLQSNGRGGDLIAADPMQESFAHDLQEKSVNEVAVVAIADRVQYLDNSRKNKLIKGVGSVLSEEGLFVIKSSRDGSGGPGWIDVYIFGGRVMRYYGTYTYRSGSFDKVEESGIEESANDITDHPGNGKDLLFKEPLRLKVLGSRASSPLTPESGPEKDLRISPAFLYSVAEHFEKRKFPWAADVFKMAGRGLEEFLKEFLDVFTEERSTEDVAQTVILHVQSGKTSEIYPGLFDFMESFELAPSKGYGRALAFSDLDDDVSDEADDVMGESDDTEEYSSKKSYVLVKELANLYLTSLEKDPYVLCERLIERRLRIVIAGRGVLDHPAIKGLFNLNADDVGEVIELYLELSDVQSEKKSDVLLEASQYFLRTFDDLKSLYHAMRSGVQVNDLDLVKKFAAKVIDRFTVPDFTQMTLSDDARIIIEKIISGKISIHTNSSIQQCPNLLERKMLLMKWRRLLEGAIRIMEGRVEANSHYLYGGIWRIIAALREELKRKGRNITVKADLDQLGLSDVLADRMLLSKAVAQLASNAADFAQSEVIISVRVDDRNGEKKIIIRVSDDGPGFTKEKKYLLEEGYYPGFQHIGTYGVTDRKEEEGKGTGAGIAIVRRIVSIYGGTFTVKNRPKRNGPGAVFEIIVPAVPVERGSGRQGSSPVRDSSHGDNFVPVAIKFIQLEIIELEQRNWDILNIVRHIIKLIAGRNWPVRFDECILGRDDMSHLPWGRNGTHHYRFEMLGKGIFYIVTYEVDGPGSVRERGPVIAKPRAIAMPGEAWSEKVREEALGLIHHINDFLGKRIVDRIWIFGSLADGFWTGHGSDIDIFLHFNDKEFITDEVYS